MNQSQTNQTSLQMVEVMRLFADRFRLDLRSFAELPDAEQWTELLVLLAICHYFQFVSDENVNNTIQNFYNLNSKQKYDQLVQIHNFLDRQLEDLDFFESVYGDILDFYRIEKIVEILPDLKSKIAFLYVIETGMTPEEDPDGFDMFAADLLIRADPELQVQARIQNAMNSRNRLNLGPIESRLARAVSAEEINTYLRQNLQNPPDQSNWSPNQPPESDKWSVREFPRADWFVLFKLVLSQGSVFETGWVFGTSWNQPADTITACYYGRVFVLLHS